MENLGVGGSFPVLWYCVGGGEHSKSVGIFSFAQSTGVGQLVSESLSEEITSCVTVYLAPL